MPRVHNPRHAACEPCRHSKVACGHEQPICLRCQSRGQGEACIYRALPFKRRKRGRDSSASQDAENEGSALLTVPTSSTPRSLRSTGLPDSSPQTTRAQQQHYPNPGFLGSSSHSTIFRHVSSSTNLMPSSSVADAGRRRSTGGRQLKRDRVPLQRGADVLTRLSDLDVVNLKALTNSGLRPEQTCHSPSTLYYAVPKQWLALHRRYHPTATAIVHGLPGLPTCSSETLPGP